MSFLKDWFLAHQAKKFFKDLSATIRYTRKADDDLFSDSQRDKLAELNNQLNAIGKGDASPRMEELQKIEETFDSVFPHKSASHAIRGFLDVVVVAASVAFGIRGLFLQPFQIPTSSMQPTLFGIHYIDRKESEPHSSSLTRLLRPFGSTTARLQPSEGGHFYPGWQHYTPPTSYLLANLWNPGALYWNGSQFRIGNHFYTLPGSIGSHLLPYLNEVKMGKDIADNEVLCDGYISTGDHLFVDRFSLHFKDFVRGDVIVFNTENITSPTQPMGGYYYIKRLVGLPGDTLKIVDDTLLIRPKGETEFRSSSEFSDRFRMINAKKGGYQGHTASGLLSDGQTITVPDNYYFALGDNTNHSLDGRNWGFIPRRNMIGRALNIFWPISRRWGLADTQEAISQPTTFPNSVYLQMKEMHLQ